MSYTDPILTTHPDEFDADVTIQTDQSTLLSGPITIPNLTVNGKLNVIAELNVTGDTNIGSDGILNVTG